MATDAAEPLDSGDHGLVEELAGRARMEVVDLARALRMPRRRIREQIRQLERGGVIRGYHAITPRAADETGSVLVMVRFTGMSRPSAANLCVLDGVRRVHALGTGWDFMLEVDAGAPLMRQLPLRGRITVLDAAADVEVLPVCGEHTCPGGTEAESAYPLPSA